MRFLVFAFTLLPLIVWSFVGEMRYSTRFLSALKAVPGKVAVSQQLKVPQNTEIKMHRIGNSPNITSLGKYRIRGEIPAAVMQKNFDEYMKMLIKQNKGKAVFNGYPNGYLPDSECKAVVEVLISFGLESQITELCIRNGLELCGPNREPMDIGQEVDLAKIIMPDGNGRTFDRRGLHWKPYKGNIAKKGFPYIADFYAIAHGVEGDLEVEGDQQEEDEQQ